MGADGRVCLGTREGDRLEEDGGKIGRETGREATEHRRQKPVRQQTQRDAAHLT